MCIKGTLTTREAKISSVSKYEALDKEHISEWQLLDHFDTPDHLFLPLLGIPLLARLMVRAKTAGPTATS